MIGTWQILLVSIVAILTILLVVIGVQLFYLLRELRVLIKKINNIVDDAEGLTKIVSSSFSSLSGFGAGLKAAANLVSLIRKKKDPEEE